MYGEASTIYLQADFTYTGEADGMCSRECLRVVRFFPRVEEYVIGSERDYDIFLWEKSTCPAFPGNIFRLIPVKLSYLPGDIS